MKTAQQIFDTVLNHLRAQGIASRDDNGSCAYRGKNGASCAIGCLIPGSFYHKSIEGFTVNNVRVMDIMQKLGISDHEKLLGRLQRCHDGMESEWESKMKFIAGYFGLDYIKA